MATATSLIAQERNNDGYHNGGSVEFGPDGFLYLAMGESSNRPCHQRVDCSLAGGILRLDVDQQGGAVSRPIGRQHRHGHVEDPIHLVGRLADAQPAHRVARVEQHVVPGEHARAVGVDRRRRKERLLEDRNRAAVAPGLVGDGKKLPKAT